MDGHTTPMFFDVTQSNKRKNVSRMKIFILKLCDPNSLHRINRYEYSWSGLKHFILHLY